MATVSDAAHVVRDHGPLLQTVPSDPTSTDAFPNAVPRHHADGRADHDDDDPKEKADRQRNGRNNPEERVIDHGRPRHPATLRNLEGHAEERRGTEAI